MHCVEKGAGPPVVPGYADAGHGYGPNLPPVMSIPVAPPTKSSDGAPVGANIKFVLPADAKLYVDGKLTPGTGTERTFYTSPLAAGQYFYDVKVETETVSMSSTKSAIGHLLGAAGAVEAIYSVKAIQTGIMPPTLNLENVSEPCQAIDLVPKLSKKRKSIWFFQTRSGLVARMPLSF